jgi:hypothetical protein
MATCARARPRRRSRVRHGRSAIATERSSHIVTGCGQRAAPPSDRDLGARSAVSSLATARATRFVRAGGLPLWNQLGGTPHRPAGRLPRPQGRFRLFVCRAGVSPPVTCGQPAASQHDRDLTQLHLIARAGRAHRRVRALARVPLGQALCTARVSNAERQLRSVGAVEKARAATSLHSWVAVSQGERPCVSLGSRVLPPRWRRGSVSRQGKEGRLRWQGRRWRSCARARAAR